MGTLGHIPCKFAQQCKYTYILAPLVASSGACITHSHILDKPQHFEPKTPLHAILLNRKFWNLSLLRATCYYIVGRPFFSSFHNVQTTRRPGCEGGTGASWIKTVATLLMLNIKLRSSQQNCVFMYSSMKTLYFIYNIYNMLFPSHTNWDKAQHKFVLSVRNKENVYENFLV